jgi:phytoene dehydrogenase-like protein
MARIILVGAGIGGLAATAALEQAGFEVYTIERA